MPGLFLAVAAAILFGASTPASKILLERLHPFQLAGLLYLGAALAVLPASLRNSGGTGVLPPDRTNRWRLAGAVVLGGVLGPVLLLAGLRVAAASSVSLLLNLELAATAVLGVIVFHEHLERRSWLGVTGILGAGAMLSGEGGWPGVGAGLLVGLACLFWASDNHLTALIDGMTPSRSTLWKGAVAGVTNLAIGTTIAHSSPQLTDVCVALAVGALSYGASITLYIAAAQRLGPTRSQGVFASAPFVGAALSFLLLGEPVTAWQVLAGLLCVASVALLVSGQHQHAHAHQRVEHVHGHAHDDAHHDHEHTEVLSGSHSHWHRHERIVHAHPHWPDLHHRHGH